MPCHVRSASVPRTRRRPSLPLSPPKVVAFFNLADPTEREVRATIERFHRGRWPLFRCYAMRRVGSVVYEVARWNPNRPDRHACVYSVVTWALTEIGLRWQDYPTLDAAREAFDAMVGSASIASRATSSGAALEGSAHHGA